METHPYSDHYSGRWESIHTHGVLAMHKQHDDTGTVILPALEALTNFLRFERDKDNVEAAQREAERRADRALEMGACGYNRPRAHQYVGKYQSCMV